MLNAKDLRKLKNEPMKAKQHFTSQKEGLINTAQTQKLQRWSYDIRFWVIDV